MKNEILPIGRVRPSDLCAAISARQRREVSDNNDGWFFAGLVAEWKADFLHLPRSSIKFRRCAHTAHVCCCKSHQASRGSNPAARRKCPAVRHHARRQTVSDRHFRRRAVREAGPTATPDYAELVRRTEATSTRALNLCLANSKLGLIF